MNPTPLNPDALANLRLLADRATEEVRHAVIEPDILHKLLDLAVAQPEVNSVEELDALPVMSVVLDVYGASVTKIDYATWVRVSTAISGGRMFHVPYLPALVLYRPEVNDGRE